MTRPEHHRESPRRRPETPKSPGRGASAKNVRHGAIAACAAIVLAALTLPLSSFAQTTRPAPSSPRPQAASPAPAAPAPQQDPLAPTLQRAQEALDRDDYDAAVPLLQKIVAARPADSVAHFELAYSLSELNRYPEAAAEYRRAIELDPKMAPAYLNLGLVLRDSDPAAAADAFRHAADLQPTESRPHFLAGGSLERAGKAADALAEYKTAVALDPADLQMHLALARALLGAGRAAEAEAKFRESLALGGDTSAAQLGIGESLLREDKNEDAVAALAEYLAAKPDDRAVRFERAVALQILNRYGEALSELDRAEAAGPPEKDYAKLRASIDLQESDWAQAAAVLEKAVAAWPDDAELHALLGRTRMRLKDYAGAEPELRRALALDSQTFAPMGDLAMTLYDSAQYAAAISEFDLLDTRRATLAGDSFIRAICYDKLHQAAQAVAEYQKFLDLDQGQNPDQDFQARQRMLTLQREIHKR